MFISVKSARKSFTPCCGFFVGLSLIPELLLIGVNCASYVYLSSGDSEQRRLIIWNLLLACIILLLKAIQLPFLFIYSTYYHRTCLYPILILWIILNLGNVILGILISIHLNDEKKDNPLLQSFFYTTIILLPTVFAFMLLVCFCMIGPICLVIHTDNNRL